MFQPQINRNLIFLVLMKNYKIWIRKEVEGIKPGVYAVSEDNESYNRIPCWCKLENGKEVSYFKSFDMLYGNSEEPIIPVYEDFKIEEYESLLNLTEVEMIEDLEGLRPHFMTVDQFINGSFDWDFDWDGFKSVKEAWICARLHDWSCKFTSQHAMTLLMLKHI